MLQQPPPGYNPFAINRQASASAQLTQPGRQGTAVLGGQPGGSSYSTPSSYLPASSEQPIHPPAMPAGSQLAAANTQAIIKALQQKGQSRG